MTILVDELFRWNGSKILWCHMASDLPGRDGLVELHVMADKIGMKRSWFQDRPNLPHYDLQPSKRALAIKNGAQPVTSGQLVERCRNRR